VSSIPKKEDIFDLLKSVNYPGFTRDIVSFGIVNNVQTEGDEIIVQIQITSLKEETLSEIENGIREVLLENTPFKKVSVDVLPPATGRQVQQPGQQAVQTNILPDVKRTIAVASGKGGVGKSTVAVNLAVALVQKQKKVGLLDLDIYGPSLPILLGFNEMPKTTEDKKLVPLDKFGMKVMSFGFISGNKAPVIWRGPMVARMTEQFFKDVVWGELDYLILDLPPGTGDIQLTLVQKLKLSGAVIVTTPQNLAVSDVRKGADMFKKVNTPVLGVIENMSGFQVSGIARDKEGNPLDSINLSFAEMDSFKDVKTDSEGLFRVGIDLFKRGGGSKESTRLNVPLLGEIPVSQELMTACDSGMPFVIHDPDSDVSRIFFQIVEKIEEGLLNQSKK
tara:strand:- start:39810 stop:40982 length:1173 start_codon:yes stop_codon:yes gene_type:complete